jgi:rod shape determining protein RodA
VRALDIPLLVVTVVLCALGGLVLDSATAHQLAWSPEVVRQTAAMGVGLLVMLACWRVSPAMLRKLAPFLYLVAVAGLVLVRIPGIGQLSHGARRWISLGPFGAFQPSEPAKLFLLLAVATLLTRRPDPSTRLSTALGALLLLAVPCGLIMLQPDLGTALVLCGTTLALLIVSGTSPVLLLALGTGGLAAAPYFMHDYQKARLMTYLNPQADPMGSGYNLLQAQTAVGSGQLFGTGLFTGPMSQHGFVPENWTDFIFTVVGEEMGFVGCIGFLALYAVLIGLLVRTALMARDRFDMLLASGVAAMLALHVLVNVGMVLSLLPATGFPLPFASYGGTAVVTHMAALGLAMGVYRRYHETSEDLWGMRTAVPWASIP